MTADDELLLVRHVLALRRSGVSAEAALEAASAGLEGRLRERASAAARRMASGESGTGDLLDRALAGGSLASLELAAIGAEARGHADEARAAARLYLVAAFAGPPALLFGMAWVGGMLRPVKMDFDFLITPYLDIVNHGIRVVGAPLVLAGVWLALRVARTWSPGGAQLRAAMAVLEGEEPAGLDPLHRAYLAARRAAATPEVAAADVAGELVGEARRSLELFRWAAPLLAAVLLGPLVTQALVLLTGPGFLALGHFGP